MIRGVFVTAPGTSDGKTFVTRALARSLARAGKVVVALKPLETGVAIQPADALALARACGQPRLAHATGLYRAALPLAPYAAALEADAAPPQLDSLTRRSCELARGADFLLIEGPGGLLVPLTPTATVAEFARALDLPLLIVAADRLGVLSSVLTCVESAASRSLRIVGVVLSDHGPREGDPSPRTNRRILQERLAFPVTAFPSCADDDDALADAAERCDLLRLLELD